MTMAAKMKTLLFVVAFLLTSAPADLIIITFKSKTLAQNFKIGAFNIIVS
jgi:hypothetical protein